VDGVDYYLQDSIVALDSYDYWSRRRTNYCCE